MSEALAELDRLRHEAIDAIASAASSEALDEVRVRFAGRKARVNEILRGIKDLPDDQKRTVSPAANALRTEIEELVARKLAELERAEEERILGSDRLDLTMPGRRPARGAPNPISEVIRRLSDVFIGLGYEIAEGPEAEDDWHNFQALNTPPDHPARSLMDTYYLTGPRGPEQALLRTHTSPVQIRVMESRKPPIYIVCPGRVYRREQVTATNAAIFHQIEGLAVDEGLTFRHLKGTLQAFAEGAYGAGTEVRLVPSFYPFTEPSAELQVTCPVCGGSGCSHCSGGWHGVGGAGMVDPNVLEFVGIDAERYTGFAFGMGIEKIPMKRYGIDDLRIFLEGDQRFLQQFRGLPVA